MSEPRPDISVIISTQNRSESLKVTLECLASANRDGIRAEVIVVDNGGSDNTEEVATSFSRRIAVRYLYEPTTTGYGKVHALNRALDAGGLGEIVAVLDDDMSPHSDWFQGVMAIGKRWPDKDLFAGKTYIIWPSDDVPGWAKKHSLESWVFSSFNVGGSDSLLETGKWFSGNHFWFRSRVLIDGKRFKNIWVTEGDFQLDLVELGFGGVAGPDAVAGHRIQPALLQRKVVLERARKSGASYGALRLQPYRNHVKQSRLFHEHPWGARLFCILNYFRWRLLYLASYLYPSDDSRFEHRLIALERMTGHLEYLRVANQLDDYSLRRRSRAD
jgi:glycosyltransferase involved in cell wall biosynthesis